MLRKQSLMSLVFGAGLLALSSSHASAAWVKEQGRPHVYYAGNGFYCHVISEEQLASYGKRPSDATEMSSVEFNRLVASLRNSGSCLWANGCYRQTGVREVYRIQGADACWVTSEAELTTQCPQSVTIISSDIRDIHHYTGPC